MHDPGASARELARILRFLDGDNRRPGAELRIDRLERDVRDVIATQKVHDGRLKVLEAHLEGNPLVLDKPAAQAVLDHLEDHEARHAWSTAAVRFLGRNVVLAIFVVVQTVVSAVSIAYLARLAEGVQK